MPDPINNNVSTSASSEGGELNWLGAKARGSAELFVPSSGTADGSAKSLGAEINYGYDDRYYFLGPERKWLTAEEGDRGDGTASNNSLGIWSLVFGYVNRNRGSGGVRELLFASGGETTIGIGSVENDNSDHYSDGVTNDNVGSENGLYLSQSVFGGVEIYAGQRFTIYPKVGISMGTFYPFGGADYYGQWLMIPRNLSLLFSVSLGYNDNNSNMAWKKAPLNDLDVAHEFAKDTVANLQVILAHNIMNAATVRGQGLLKDNELAGGAADQQTEDIPPLQAVSSGFSAFGVGDEIEFIDKAQESGREAVADIKLVEKGLVGLIFSLWGASEGAEGADLVSSGLVNLQIGAAGLLMRSKVSLALQNASRFAICSAMVSLGGELDSDGLISGGMNACLGMTLAADAAKPGSISATTVSYYPWTSFDGEAKGNRGVLRKLAHLPVAKNVNITAGSEIAMPASEIGNLDKRTIDAEEDSPYSSANLPSSLRSSMGGELVLRLGDHVKLAPNVDVHAVQQFGSREKAGVGAGAELALMIKLHEKVDLDVRTRAVAEHMIGGSNNAEFMPVAVGLTVYTDHLFE